MSKFCVKTFPWHKKKKKKEGKGDRRAVLEAGNPYSAVEKPPRMTQASGLRAGFSITQLQPAGLRAGLGKAGLELANLKSDEQGRAGAKLSPAKTPRSPLGAFFLN